MINSSKSLTGIYRAKVVSTYDPKEICRIRIRVPSLHGFNTENGLSDDALPFAMPCTLDATLDSGTFIVPEVGSTVFVFFEGGEVNKPIYFGSSISYGYDEDVQYLGTDKSNMFKNTEGKRLKRASEADTPSNIYRNGIFRKFILYKSRKGSSIEFCDDDDNEHLSLYDRLGQCLTMFSPVSSIDNSDGMANRGVFSLLKNKLAISKKAILILKSLSSSFLRFVSDPSYTQNDYITIYNDKSSGISINIGKDNRLLIYYGDKSKIELKDSNVTIQAADVNIKGNLNVQGSIKSNSTIQGNVQGKCPCTGSNGYNNPAVLNLSDIKSYTNQNDENIIDE